MAGGRAKSAKARKGVVSKRKTVSKSRLNMAKTAAKVKTRVTRTKPKSRTKTKTKTKKVARSGAKPRSTTRTSAKRKSAKARPGEAVKRVVTAASRARKRRPTRVEALLFAELENLAEFIHAAKAEIALIRPDDVKTNFLPRAANELDAIVEATAVATNTIMDACEDLERLMATVEGSVNQELMNATTKIYEACTFQDITGQRISKVVSTLQHIENRIDRLTAVLGASGDTGKTKNPAQKPATTTKEDKPLGDGELLEGPQLKGQGRSQAEIDDLLASFD